jgi:glutaredoxin 3
MPSARVVVYSTDYCPYCTRAKQLLAKKGVSFEEVRVDDRPDLRQWLQQVTRQRTVPQVFVNGRPLGGFTDIAALDQKGRLDPLLETAPSGGEPEVRV